MAPVSRTTTTPHDIINCKDCLRVRLAQIKIHSNNISGSFGANDENDNQINIYRASKYIDRIDHSTEKFTHIVLEFNCEYFSAFFYKNQCISFLLVELNKRRQ